MVLSIPVAGSYSIIFDNTDEPSGGAEDGSDIQVEIGTPSLTIPSLFGNVWSDGTNLVIMLTKETTWH